MKKIKRVKIKLINCLVVFSIVLVIGLIIYNLFNKRIDAIYVLNNKVLTENEIIELGNIKLYPKYKDILCNNIRKRLNASPFIKEAIVHKNFNSLTIKIKEYDILCYQKYNEQILLSNGQSVYSEKQFWGLPVLNNQIDNEYLNEFIKKMCLVKKDILNKVSEINYAPTKLDKKRFLLYMNDQNYVYLTLTKFTYINNYNELLPKLEGKKGILYLDSGNHFEIKK